MASKVFAQVKSTSPENTKYLDTLTSRELEVLRLVGKGKSNHEIASILNLSIGTVKNYITQILSKLEMRDRIAVALWEQEKL
ncbi:MAG: LuxR C-terminal-related transcriptional regulator [Cyanobacteria bacterium P01_A01_bin.40]